MSCRKYTKLSVCALGFSFGLIWGLGVFLIALLSLFFSIGTPLLNILASVYLGYQANVLGAIIGFLWAFLDGFIAGALIAAIYNYWSVKCPCPFCKKNKCCDK